MRDYITEVITVNGAPVKVKMASDAGGAGNIDFRLLDQVKSMKTRREEEKADTDIEDMRAAMGGANYNLNTVEIYTRYIEIEATCGKVPVWMYYPRKITGKCPGLLYVHGGAFFGGSVFAVENPCRLIAERTGCVVCNIDYSLAPEHPYPIPVNQVYEVLSRISASAGNYNIDKDRLYIGGDSAGGNISAAVAQMDRDQKSNLLKGQVLIYAKLTFTNTELPGYQRDLNIFELNESHDRYLEVVTDIGSDSSNAADEAVYVQGKHDIRTPYISPAFGAKEDLPETLMIQAEYDGLRLEGEYYGQQLWRAGIPVKQIRYRNVIHGFFDRLGILPQSEDAVNEIASFISGQEG